MGLGWGEGEPTVLENLARERNMPPEVIAILRNNMTDIFAIEQGVGGVKAITMLWRNFDNIWKTYDATKDFRAVLDKNMSDVLAIEQGLGGLKAIAPLWPHFEKILDTYNAAKAAQPHK